MPLTETSLESIQKRDKSWIDLAEKKHKDVLLPDAKRFLQRLNHEFTAQTEDENQSIFNSYFVNLKRLFPQLMPKEIKVTVTAPLGKETIITPNQMTFDNKRAAQILDNRLNYILNEKKTKYLLGALIIDNLVANLSTVIVGQDTKIIEQVDEQPEPMMALLEEKKENNEEIIGETIEPVKVLSLDKKPELSLVRVSFRDAKVDPDSVADWFDDGRYFVRTLKIDVWEAKERFPEQMANKDVGFDIADYETSKINVKTNVDDKDDEKVATDSTGKEELKKIPIVELYDYTGDKVKRRVYFGPGKVFVGEDEYNYDPVVLLKLNYLPDTTYPPSDFKYYESIVDEQNFYSTVALNQADKAAARKVYFDKDSIGPEEQAKAKNPNDMEFIPVATNGVDIRTKVFVDQGAQVNSDIINGAERAATQISLISGVNQLQLGNVPNAPATNASIANQAFLSANDSNRDKAKDYFELICQRIVAVLKEISLSTESFVIENSEGVKEEIKWNQKDIQFADVDIKVNFSSDLPSDVKMTRMQNFASWVFDPIKIQLLAKEGKKVQVFEFIKEVGKTFIPDANFDKLIVDDKLFITPAEENILLMGGKFVEPQPNENFQDHLDNHEAFMQVHPIYQTLPFEVQQLFINHIALTRQMAQQQEALATKSQQSKPMMEGQIQGATQGAAQQ